MADIKALWENKLKSLRADINKGGSSFLTKFYGFLLWTEWCAIYQWCKGNGTGDTTYGKTENCGQFALNFFKQGKLINPLTNPDAVQVGDYITYCYDDSMSSFTPNFRSHDHIEIVTKVYKNSAGHVTSVDSIGGNTGADDCRNSKVKEHNWDKSYFAGYMRSPLSQGGGDVKPKVRTTLYLRILGKNYDNRVGQVKNLQRILNRCGYRDADGKQLSEDGIFSTKTEYAYKQWEKKHGRKVDGIFDEGDQDVFYSTDD